MARSRPERKKQPDVTKVMPMELRVGDRLTEETGEWEIVTLAWTKSSTL